MFCLDGKNLLNVYGAQGVAVQGDTDTAGAGCILDSVIEQIAPAEDCAENQPSRPSGVDGIDPQRTVELTAFNGKRKTQVMMAMREVVVAGHSQAKMKKNISAHKASPLYLAQNHGKPSRKRHAKPIAITKTIHKK